MKKGINYQPAYNVQAATNNQVVVAYGVTDNGSDTNLLLPMIDKTENNTGKKVKKAKADASYFSKDNMKGVQGREIDAYIPDQLKTIEERQERDNTIPKYDRRNFQYDESQNEFICPENKRLRYRDTYKGVKQYIGADCHVCPARSKCTRGKSRHLTIDWQYENYKTEMRKKLNSELGKNKYLERMSDVEPVFGNIIYNQQAGYFLCRGKPMVKIEFGLRCTAHNLVKIANWSRKNENKAQLDILMRLPAVTRGDQTQIELNFLLVFQCTVVRTF